MDEWMLCTFPKFAGYPTLMPEFVEFLAERRQQPVPEVSEMVRRAQEIFPGRWGGDAYRDLTTLLMEMLKPVYDDRNDAEIIETYKHHADFDFLRMLSYPVPRPEDLALPASHLDRHPEVHIVDYGCGLAHRSTALGRLLVSRNVRVHMHFVDIKRPLFYSFISFNCRRYGLQHEFIEITAEHLYPELPAHHYCDNVSVLEHVRDPLRVIENTHKAMLPGGLFLVGAVDSCPEMMHIHPDLACVRDRLGELGYHSVGAGWDGLPLLQRP